VATRKEHLGGYGKRLLGRKIKANSLVHAYEGEGVDHVVDVCGAGPLEQSSKAVRDEGIISVVRFRCNLGRTVQM
jgi:hypothetical protein